VTLLIFAAVRRAAAAPAAIDRYLLPAGPTAANPSQLHAAVDRWGRKTGGRTAYRYVDSAAFYAGGVNNGGKMGGERGKGRSVKGSCIVSLKLKFLALPLAAYSPRICISQA